MIIKFECSKCGNKSPQRAKYYDGALGYEAIVCLNCGTYYDHTGMHEADDWSKRFVGIDEYSKLMKCLAIAKSER